MELIAKITDENIGEKTHEIDDPVTRQAVRAILINDSGEIALLHKVKKNEYKLIGGGIESNESKEQALKREVLEETGCQMQIIKELGYTEEYKTINNFIQTSYIYVAKVLKNTNELHLTQQEKDEGAELCWYTPQIAIKQIAESYEKLIPSKYDNLYSTKFVIKRDEAILRYYIQNI